ncbi:MAG: toast rack family protein [Bacteroidota bacterium]
MSSIIRIAILTLAATSVVVAFFTLELTRKDIPRTSEKEIRAEVDAAFGRINIARGERDKILVAEFREESNDERDPQIYYKVRGDRGELKIETKESSSWWGSSKKKKERREWTLKFTDAIPIDFKIEFGAGEADIDLSGLRVQNLSISSGASSTELRCDEPNPIVANRVDIESGVSKFDARDLCNLNFEKLSFSGGVGSYKLDFGGKPRRDAKVRVEVGLGAVTLYLPKETPARVEFDDHWFAGFDIDEGFQKVKKGVYETENYKNAGARLTIELEAGLGSVKVRQR